MPPDHRDPTQAAAWLRRARSNLARARTGRSTPEVLYEDLCFDAQQTAEKAIKAILVHRQIQFPKTHDIIGLLTLVQKSEIAVPEAIQQADLLTGYAVETRYPGMSEEVSKEDYLEAVELAERVFHWAESLLSSSGKHPKS
ncbi:MAG: HEPN domain-containing protein [Nitrospiraceae bacterium]